MSFVVLPHLQQRNRHRWNNSVKQALPHLSVNNRRKLNEVQKNTTVLQYLYQKQANGKNKVISGVTIRLE